jgi:hypothetical protein
MAEKNCSAEVEGGASAERRARVLHFGGGSRNVHVFCTSGIIGIIGRLPLEDGPVGGIRAALTKSLARDGIMRTMRAIFRGPRRPRGL